MPALRSGSSMEIWTDILRAFGPVESVLFRLHCPRKGWAIRFPGMCDVMAFSLVAHGHACMRSSRMVRPLRLESGDIVFRIRGFEHELSGDAPPRVAADLIPWSSWRNTSHRRAQTIVVCGGFVFRKAPSHPIFEELPAVIVITAQEIRANRPLRSAIQLLYAELDKHGNEVAEAIRAPLLDVLFYYVLQHWLDRKAPNGRLKLMFNDPMLHRALTALHADVSKGWTVEALARESGLSRTAFGVRFKHALNQTPAHYVARVRMQRAMDLLGKTDRSIVEVARDVGYADPFAFSKAFKRLHGVPPNQFRSAEARSRAG